MAHAFDMHFGTLFNYTLWALSAGATLDIIDYNSHLTKKFKDMKEKFELDTNISLLSAGDNADFTELCRKAAENIHLLKENEINRLAEKVFTKETADRYKDSDMIHFSDDCRSFSISFGIPMPKGGK